MLKLLKDIEKIVDKNDYLVVDDYYTKDHWIYGSNASYSSLEMGGGKYCIIDTEQIQNNEILFDDEYITTEELAKNILEHWREI